MFTILMSIVGLFVFIVSLITANFKKAFKRFLMFVAVGFVIDVAILATFGTFVHSLT